MASNPPGKCCFMGHRHTGEPKGEHKDVFGLNTYVTGDSSNDKIIVVLTDVFGNKFKNVLLIADKLGEEGFKVYIPDILFGDEIESLDGSVDFNAWKARHSAEATRSVVDPFMAKLREELSPKFVGVIGYCFGAKYAIQQIDAKSGLADAAALAHPSFVSIEEVAAIGSKPLLISAAETDNIFPAELRRQTEDKLKEIGARYQLDLFSGVSHGFACRGDLSDPVLKYAMDKALLDQVYWFQHFSKNA